MAQDARPTTQGKPEWEKGRVGEGEKEDAGHKAGFRGSPPGRG